MRWIPGAASALLLSALGPAARGEDASPTGADARLVTECMARNLPEETSVQTIAMKATDRVGSERTIRAVVHWKRFDDGNSRVRATFSEPTEIAGSALLLIQTSGPSDVFLYTPSLDKVRRINTHAMKGTIYGTDFSYEDFARLQGVGVEQSVVRKPDETLDGRAVYVIEARAPADSGSAYAHGRSWVDRETCVPTKVELFEVGDRLRKVLRAAPDKVQKHGARWLPHELVMIDQRDETRTVLTVEKLEVGVPVPDKTFSLAQLQRAGKRGN